MLIFKILLTCLVFNISACNNCLCWYSKSCWPALYLIFQPARNETNRYPEATARHHVAIKPLRNSGKTSVIRIRWHDYQSFITPSKRHECCHCMFNFRTCGGKNEAIISVQQLNLEKRGWHVYITLQSSMIIKSKVVPFRPLKAYRGSLLWNDRSWSWGGVRDIRIAGINQ